MPLVVKILCFYLFTFLFELPVKKNTIQKTVIVEMEHKLVNISDPAFRAYILNIPQRVKNRQQGEPESVGNPFLEEPHNSLFSTGKTFC